MKVLNVNHIIESSYGGGTAERTLQMSYFLAKHNVDAKILTTDLHLTDSTKNYIKDVDLYVLPCLSHRFLIPQPQFIKVNRLIKKVDIIHLMNHWTLLNAWIYFNLRLHKKPYVFCPAGALEIFGRSRFIKRLYNIIIGKKIVKNASYCIATTNKEVNQFIDLGVNPDKIIIIPNGVRPRELSSSIDSESFLLRHGLKDKKIILFIGRFNIIKGPDLLIQAFDKIKDLVLDYTLVLAGPDEGLLDYIIEYIDKHDLDDRVKVIGPIYGDEKEIAYEVASLLALPSRREVMSMVVLEAGVHGTPTVFTDQCGLSTLSDIGHGVEVKVTVEGIAQGILDMLDSKQYGRFKENDLKNYISKHYGWETIVKKYINLYKKILFQ
jgi:glycosyltransferase involved in cell wall biosynthesis